MKCHFPSMMMNTFIKTETVIFPMQIVHPKGLPRACVAVSLPRFVPVHALEASIV